MEAGETPQEALRREIHEELDAEIEVGELLRTIDYDYDGSWQNLYLIAENPSTEIHELALPGDDSLSIQLISPSVNSIITLKFYKGI